MSHTTCLVVVWYVQDTFVGNRKDAKMRHPDKVAKGRVCSGVFSHFFFGVVHEFPRLWRFLADTTFQERPYCTQNCALQTPGYACTKCRQRHENTYQVQVGGPRLDHQLFGRSSRQLAKLVSCDHTCCSRACRVSAVSRPQREKACTQSLLPPLRYEPPLHTAPSL